MTIYRKAKFSISIADAHQAPADQGYEVAFAGRSNAGKSSAINAICDHKQLARTSKTPGRTQLINFFDLDEQRRLVDLPGYGYAKVTPKMQQQWQTLITNYLQHRQSLRGIILLMDIRHPIKPFDEQLLEFAYSYELPVHILLTKADKLKRNAAMQSLMEVKRYISQERGEVSVQLFSALKKTGIEDAQGQLNQWLDLG